MTLRTLVAVTFDGLLDFCCMNSDLLLFVRRIMGAIQTCCAILTRCDGLGAIASLAKLYFGATGANGESHVYITRSTLAIPGGGPKLAANGLSYARQGGNAAGY